MPESEGQKRQAELQQKIAEVKRSVFEEELRRLDTEAQRCAEEMLQQHHVRLEEESRKQLQQVSEERRNEEERIRRAVEDACRQLDQEAQKKIEARRREEEELRRHAEEERRQQEERERQRLEEEERRRREEEARLRAEQERRRREEDLRRAEEERKRRLEEERRRQEEELRRIEQMRKQREEEQQRQSLERAERVRTLLDNARNFLASGDRELALVEVAKALVNDPTNKEALDLEAAIKGRREKPTVQPTGEERPQTKPRSAGKVMSRTPPVQPRSRTPLVVAIVLSVIILAVLVVVQLRQGVLTRDATFAIVPWTSGSAVLEESILGSSLAEEVSRRFVPYRAGTTLDYASSYTLIRRQPNAHRVFFRSGYSYILQGSVTRSGELVSASLQLADSTGRVYWSKRYDTPLASLMGLPGEIEHDIADVLSISPLTDSELSNTGTTSADAYQFYLRGRELLHRRTAESTQNAYQLLLEAVQQDPKFIDALCAAADALLIQREEGWNTTDSVLTHAQRFSEAVLTQQSTNAEAHWLLGRILTQKLQFNGALAQFDSAATYTPGFSRAHFGRAIVFLRTGRYNEAADALKHTYRLDPHNPDVLQTFASMYQLLRAPRKYMAYYDLLLPLVDDSTTCLVGPVADAVTIDPELWLSQSHRIVVACYRRLEMHSNDYYAFYRLARLEQVTGNVEADSLLRQLENTLRAEVRRNPNDAVRLMYLALTMTRLGRFNEAAVLAERAADLDPSSATIRYKIAQMYSIQMYSQKRKEIDPKKREESLRYLQEAMSISYQLDEITDADFYNMYDQPEFKAVVHETLN